MSRVTGVVTDRLFPAADSHELLARTRQTIWTQKGKTLHHQGPQKVVCVCASLQNNDSDCIWTYTNVFVCSHIKWDEMYVCCVPVGLLFYCYSCCFHSTYFPFCLKLIICTAAPQSSSCHAPNKESLRYYWPDILLCRDLDWKCLNTFVVVIGWLK